PCSFSDVIYLPPLTTRLPYTTLFRSLESRSQPFFERGNFVRRAVAAEHNLLLRVVEGVERMKELGLCPFFAGKKLDVVDEEGTRSEEHTSELQSPDHLVCRLLLEKKK